MKTASTANSAQTQQRMHGALVIALGAYLVGPAAGAVQIRAAIDRGIRALRPARSVTGCQVVNMGQLIDHPGWTERYAGSAPVIRRSGKSDFMVARRLAPTTTWAPLFTSGRSAASPEAAGRANSTTARSPPGKAITPRCEP